MAAGKGFAAAPAGGGLVLPATAGEYPRWGLGGMQLAVWESRGIVCDVAPWGRGVACTLQ